MKGTIPITLLDLFNRSINLILFPLLLNRFSNSEFGELALAMAISGIVTTCLNSGTVVAALKSKYNRGHTDIFKHQYAFNFYLLILLFVVFLFLNSNWIWFFGLVHGGLAHLKNIWFNEHKSNGTYDKVAITVLLMSFINLGLTIYLVYYYEIGYLARLIPMIISLSLPLVYCFSFLTKPAVRIKEYIRFLCDEKISIYLSFLPFLFYTLPGYLDKIVIERLYSTESMGMWFILMTFVSPLEVFVNSSLAIKEKQLHSLKIKDLNGLVNSLVIVWIGLSILTLILVGTLIIFKEELMGRELGFDLTLCVLLVSLVLAITRPIDTLYVFQEKEKLQLSSLMVKNFLFFLVLCLAYSLGLKGIVLSFSISSIFFVIFRFRIFLKI